MSRHVIRDGYLTRPETCTLTISAATLRAAGFASQAEAHAARRCAPLASSERPRRAASTPLAQLLAEEVTR